MDCGYIIEIWRGICLMHIKNINTSTGLKYNHNLDWCQFNLHFQENCVWPPTLYQQLVPTSAIVLPLRIIIQDTSVLQFVGLYKSKTKFNKSNEAYTLY